MWFTPLTHLNKVIMLISKYQTLWQLLTPLSEETVSISGSLLNLLINGLSRRPVSPLRESCECRQTNLLSVHNTWLITHWIRHNMTVSVSLLLLLITLFCWISISSGTKSSKSTTPIQSQALGGRRETLLEEFLEERLMLSGTGGETGGEADVVCSRNRGHWEICQIYQNRHKHIQNHDCLEHIKMI